MHAFYLIAALANPIVLDVPGLTCPTCVRPVQRALALTDGVQKVSVDWRSAKVEVTVEPNTVTRDNLVATLDSAGFAVSETPIVKGNGDYLSIDSIPPRVDELAVWGKLTVVAVCTPGCAPCVEIKKDLEVLMSRVRELAVRVVVVQGDQGPGSDFIPNGGEVPFLYVYDRQKKLRYRGGNSGHEVYGTVESLLGVNAPSP